MNRSLLLGGLGLLGAATLFALTKPQPKAPLLPAPSAPAPPPSAGPGTTVPGPPTMPTDSAGQALLEQYNQAAANWQTGDPDAMLTLANALRAHGLTTQADKLMALREQRQFLILNPPPPSPWSQSWLRNRPPPGGPPLSPPPKA